MLNSISVIQKNVNKNKKILHKLIIYSHFAGHTLHNLYNFMLQRDDFIVHDITVLQYFGLDFFVYADHRGFRVLESKVCQHYQYLRRVPVADNVSHPESVYEF